MLPLITVIIPVYNTELYIKKCLDSLTKQTYSNIEIIVVDDGSTDESSNICDQYEQIDSRVIVLHKNNGGQGAARNVALNLAKGELICFVDSDDSVKNDYIEFLYKLLIDHDLDIAVCNYELYDEYGNFIRKRIDGSGYRELNGIESIYSMWTQGVINIGPWGKLYKRELWSTIRFNESFSEDWSTMHLIYEKAKKVGYSYECKLNYLVRKNSSIRGFQEKKLVMLKIAEENLKFAEKYPELLPAAKQKAASVYFHLLFQLPSEKKYNSQRKEIERRIKRIRKEILGDPKCIRKTKIALLLSYFGFDFTKIIFELLKKITFVF